MPRADETRQKVVDAARLLLERGDPATMGAIAREAGVTRQLLYVRFEGGRAEILLEVSRQVDREVRAGAQHRIDEAASAVDALRETVRLQGEIKPRIHAVATAIDLLRRSDNDAQAAWREREEARLRRCRDVVDRLEGEGALADGWSVDAAAGALWSATSLRAWEELVVEGTWTTDTWVAHTTHLLERALLDDPPADR